MEVLRELGFDPILFVAQIVNFLIILFILKKILYKPVLDMLNKRQGEINKGLKDKKEAQILLEQTEENEKKILQKANENAKKIINAAQDDASIIKSKAEESAKKDSERIIQEAKSTINQEIFTAEEKLTERMGSLALSLLQKSLVGVFGEKEQIQILKKAETELEKHL